MRRAVTVLQLLDTGPGRVHGQRPTYRVNSVQTIGAVQSQRRERLAEQLTGPVDIAVRVVFRRQIGACENGHTFHAATLHAGGVGQYIGGEPLEKLGPGPLADGDDRPVQRSFRDSCSTCGQSRSRTPPVAGLTLVLLRADRNTRRRSHR